MWVGARSGLLMCEQAWWPLHHLQPSRVRAVTLGMTWCPAAEATCFPTGTVSGVASLGRCHNAQIHKHVSSTCKYHAWSLVLSDALNESVLVGRQSHMLSLHDPCSMFWRNHSEVHSLQKLQVWGLPWWLSGKEPSCQCRRHRFESWSGKTPHATKQLKQCAATDLLSLCSGACEP